MPPPPPPTPQPKPESPGAKIPMHMRVANEIVATEATFVLGLELLIQVYVKPLAATGITIIATNVQKQLFSNVETLFESNTKLMNDLKKDMELNPDKGRNVGKIFKDFAPFLKMFTTYLENVESALKATSELMESSESFRKFVEIGQSDPRCKGLSLASFLIMPVQRVPRYKMLLDNLLTQVMKPEGENDRKDVADLEIAAHLISVAAKHNNEMIRRRENQNKLRSIQIRFEAGTKLSLMDDPLRCFIKSGMLTKLSRKSPQPRMFYLFNDLLIYGDQKSNGTYKVARVIQLSKCQATSSLDLQEERETASAAVECMIDIESPEKSFVCVAQTVEDKIAWVTAISDAILELRTHFEEDSEFSAIWKSDKSAHSCTLCVKKFSWTFRKHHCRNCGSVVCGDCSGGSALLKHIDEKNHVRVCNECVDQGVGQASSRRFSGDLLRSSSSMRNTSSDNLAQRGSRGSRTFSNSLSSAASRPSLTGEEMLSQLRVSDTGRYSSADGPLPNSSPGKPVQKNILTPEWAKEEVKNGDVVKISSAPAVTPPKPKSTPPPVPAAKSLSLPPPISKPAQAAPAPQSPKELQKILKVATPPPIPSPKKSAAKPDPGAEFAAAVASIAAAEQSAKAKQTAAADRADQAAAGGGSSPSSAPPIVRRPSILRTDSFSAKNDPHLYPYDSLRGKSFDLLPHGVDPGCREMSLMDDDFMRIIGMSKVDWKDIPKWKKESKRKEKDLF